MRGTKEIVAFVAALILCCSGLSGQVGFSSSAVASTVPGEIDLSSIGYQQFSEMARRSGAANLSLDFLDRDHILFTFNSKKLFTRHPDCPSTHDDRMVHAAVLDASTGKVLGQADWYLHDSRRYIWPLGSGKILLRRLNSLFVVDGDLRETQLWTSPKDLLWVSATPDGKQIITETMDEASPPSVASKTKQAAKTRVQIEFRDTNSMAVQRVIHSDKPTNIEALSSGLASVIAGFSGKVWLVRFGPSEQQRANIARVRTRRIPDVLYLSSNTLLIGRDSSGGSGYSVSAFTVTGNRLWRQHWNAHRYEPTLTRSEDGSRFAISTLTLVDAPQTSTEENSSQQEGLEQRIEVFDTASGTHVFTATASPIVLHGQNYALSPDGSRFAVLRGTQIEVHDLPPMTPEEHAKYSAVKADVPGLYIPPAEHADTDASNPVFTTAVVEPDDGKEESAAPAGSVDSAEASARSTPAVTGQEKASNPLPAVSDPEAPDPVMTLKTSTQVVGLDVVVTGSGGHTVGNVPRRDFQVHEDGTPQAISYFDEVKEDVSSAPVAPPNNNEVAPNIFTNRSPSPETESVTMVLYDLLNTPADQQQRAKLELLKFLENKPKGSRFALCALSESLQMIQGFTPDESLLIRAAKAQKGSLRYTSLLNQDAQDQQTISWLAQGSVRLQSRDSRFAASAGVMLDTAGRLEQEDSERRGRDLDMRAWLVMDAFTQLARYLSAIPGRKSLIWLSGSFPLGVFPGVDLRNSDSTSSSYIEQIKQAVNLMAESHIAVYPVDVRGLTASSMQTSTVTMPTGPAQSATPSHSVFAPNTQVKQFDELANLTAAGDIGGNLAGGDSPFMQEMTEHGIMDQIAADTGGKTFYNTNGIEKAMAVVMDHSTNYYALSYTPSNKKYDGKFRKIKVSLGVSEKKLHLIHRSGYFAVDPDSPGESRKDAARGFGLAAMQHGSPQAHQIFFEARVVPLGKPEKVDPTAAGLLITVSKKRKRHEQDARPPEPVEVQRYAVDYAITLGQLRFDTTAQAERHGIVNFMITSFDEDGTLRTSIVSRATSDLKPESYQEILTGGLRLRQVVAVPV